jgi:hypothetical protein
VSVAVVVAVVAAAMVATGSASPAIAFQATGHWVFNRAESAVAHVDGGTNQVDARVAVPNAGPAPLFTLQGEKQGFVVGRQAVTVFGRSTLTVDSSFPTAGPELPVGIEVLGGPYLVYQQAGTIVRLGVPPTTIQVGGRVGRPAYTDDGTVWLHRTDNGVICALRRGADALDCSAQTPAGLAGSLTVVSTSAAFVDTSTDAVQIIDAPTAGAVVPLGVDLPDAPLIADRDTQGRLPVVLPGPNRLLLADSAGVPTGRAGGTPVTVGLGEGTFTSPVASDGVVAVVEQTHNRLLVFAVDGRSLGETDLPPGSGPSSIMRGGDGRIYVDDADGAATHVVEADGSVKSVNTGGAVEAVSAAPAQLAALISPPPVRDPYRMIPAPPGQDGGPPVQVPKPLPPVPNPPLPVPPPPLPPPPALPSAPTDVNAALGANGAVAVTWSPADGHGLPVTYSVSANGAGARTTATMALTFTGLARGVGYSFVATATTSAGTGPSSVPSRTLIIPALLDVTTASLPGATVGSAYSATLAASGGTPPYRWSESSGSLPAGLTLGVGGVVSGTVTSGPSATFTATVEDAGRQSATRSFTVSVAVPQLIGDLNQDGLVGCIDVNILKSQYNQTGPGHSGDLNKDLVVNITDLSILLSHYKGDGTGPCQ